MANGIPWVNRMVLRTSNGQGIEDIQNYNVIQRILSNFETNDYKFARSEVNGDYRANENNTVADVALKHSVGMTYIHDLQSGILGKGQQHYIPIGLFSASGGFSFELELYLEENAIATVSGNATQGSYEISNVSLQMEIVTLPNSITDRLNQELNSENKVSIPFCTYRLHQAYFPQSSTSVDVSISESAHDPETIYTVIRPQNLVPILNIVDTDFESRDNMSSLGGYGTPSTAYSNAVLSYQFRYDSKYYPDAKAEMAPYDSKLALFNAIHLLDLADKAVFCAGQNRTNCRWDADNTFAIVQSFKTSRDNFNNGLNSSSSGAPVELVITLRAPATSAMRIDNFVKSNYTLNIMKGGLTSLVNGVIQNDS